MKLSNKINSDIKSITSVECFSFLSKIANSFLIDVRTKPEWEFIGIPDLSTLNKNTIFSSWHIYPEMKINLFFENKLFESNIEKNDKLFLICRSGTRSYHAAEFLVSRGYNHCFNISDGFEGKKNTSSQRSVIDGWKYHNLPWKQ